MSLQQLVQNSSATKIIDEFIFLKENVFPEEKWLPTRNRYSKDIVQRLKQETNPPSSPKQLAQYIGSSSILHYSDAWNFFASSIENLLNGDTSNSVFFAYYAQIRAVMSFFATEGIGVFDRNHFSFEKNGSCNRYQSSTHSAIKEILNEWSSHQNKSKKLLELIKYDNKPLFSWISAAGVILGSPSRIELAKDWFRAWSVDLVLLNEDRDIRNEVSYRPKGIRLMKNSCNFKDSLEFCVNFWQASEPSGLNKFSILDKHLLRNSLFYIYKTRTGKSHYRTNKYELYIQKTMENLGYQPEGFLFDFLCYKNTPNNHPILIEASKKGFIERKSEINPLSILARAFILLRISAFAIEEFLNKTSTSSQDIEFWWEKNGEEKGLWLSKDPPEELDDLWADIKESIINISKYVNDNNDIQVIDTRNHFSFDLVRLRQFSRVIYWSLNL